MIEPTTLRTQQKQQRRRRILNAASNLFVEHGFSSTTIKEIAARASVSPPTVHKYYGTRQKLLFDLVVDCGEEINDAVDAETTSDMSPVEAVNLVLTRIVEGSLEHMDRKTWLHAFAVFSNEASSQNTPQLEDAIADQYANLERVFDGLIARRKLSPQFDTATAREMLQIVNSSFFAMLLGNEIDMASYKSKIHRFVDFVLQSHVLMEPCGRIS